MRTIVTIILVLSWMNIPAQTTLPGWFNTTFGQVHGEELYFLDVNNNTIKRGSDSIIISEVKNPNFQAYTVKGDTTLIYNNTTSPSLVIVNWKCKEVHNVKIKLNKDLRRGFRLNNIYTNSAIVIDGDEALIPVYSEKPAQNDKRVTWVSICMKNGKVVRIVKPDIDNDALPAFYDMDIPKISKGNTFLGSSHSQTFRSLDGAKLDLSPIFNHFQSFPFTETNTRKEHEMFEGRNVLHSLFLESIAVNDSHVVAVVRPSVRDTHKLDSAFFQAWEDHYILIDTLKQGCPRPTEYTLDWFDAHNVRPFEVIIMDRSSGDIDQLDIGEGFKDLISISSNKFVLYRSFDGERYTSEKSIKRE